MPTLDFKGKPFVYSHHLSVPFRELIIDADKSVTADGETPGLDGNLIIHGDNLEALKALLPRYAGKVDVIYIDPPYNTGNEGWAYNDNVNAPQLKAWLGKTVDAEDMERHDKWLCMMWPRLQLLKELLAEQGSIWISCNNAEFHRLKMILDEIFGEDTEQTVLVTQSNIRGQTYKNIADTHEYIICYSRSTEFSPLKLSTDERHEIWELRNRNPKFTPANRPNLYYPIYASEKEDEAGLRQVSLERSADFPVEIYPVNSAGEKSVWRWGRATVAADLAKGQDSAVRARRVRAGNFIAVQKVEKSDKSLKSLLLGAEYTTESGSKALREIGLGDLFQFPKPIAVPRTVIEVSVDSEALILDSFAGSGTTAHAVLALNKADGGNRKFILIETEDYADTLTAERVRRVIKGVPGAKDDALKAGLGGSFTYCDLGEAMDLERFFAEDGKAPGWDQVARYVAYTATGETLAAAEGPDGFAGHAGPYRLHLIYRDDPKWMRSNAAMLDLTTAERIAEAAKADGGKPVLVFAAGKLMGQRALGPLGITFCQLPYSVHRILGEGIEGVAGVDAG